MKKRALLLLLTAFCCGVSAGTLIYKNRDGEQKRVSGLKIISIDSKKMVVKINEGTETIPLSQMVKYYDTDIKGGGEFEDNTAQYDIRLGEGKISSDKKKGGAVTFSIPFDVFRREGEKMDSAMRYPYIFLFVLSADADGHRTMTSYGFPSAARLSLKNYDEAKMQEKVLSLKRRTYHSDDVSRLGQPSAASRTMGGEKTATFSLSNLKKNSVIAWYVVAWNKDSISATKEWHDSSHKVGKNWWIR